MANTAVKGTSYLIRTQTGPVVSGAATWETVVCLTTNGFQPSDNQISTSSKCTGGWAQSISGEKGWSLTGEAQAILGTPDAGTASWKKYATLWKAGTIFAAELYEKDSLALLVRGDVMVTDIPLTAPNEDLVTFNITLTGQGEPFFDPEP